jgi:hypothetical protein
LIAGDVTDEVPVVKDDDPVSLAMQKIEEYDLETIPWEVRESAYGVRASQHRDIIQSLQSPPRRMGHRPVPDESKPESTASAARFSALYLTFIHRKKNESDNIHAVRCSMAEREFVFKE